MKRILYLLIIAISSIFAGYLGAQLSLETMALHRPEPLDEKLDANLGRWIEIKNSYEKKVGEEMIVGVDGKIETYTWGGENWIKKDFEWVPSPYTEYWGNKCMISIYPSDNLEGTEIRIVDDGRPGVQKWKVKNGVWIEDKENETK